MYVRGNTYKVKILIEKNYIFSLYIVNSIIEYRNKLISSPAHLHFVECSLYIRGNAYKVKILIEKHDILSLYIINSIIEYLNKLVSSPAYWRTLALR